MEPGVKNLVRILACVAVAGLLVSRTGQAQTCNLGTTAFFDESSRCVGAGRVPGCETARSYRLKPWRYGTKQYLFTSTWSSLNLYDISSPTGTPTAQFILPPNQPWGEPPPLSDWDELQWDAAVADGYEYGIAMFAHHGWVSFRIENPDSPTGLTVKKAVRFKNPDTALRPRFARLFQGSDGQWYAVGSYLDGVNTAVSIVSMGADASDPQLVKTFGASEIPTNRKIESADIGGQWWIFTNRSLSDPGSMGVAIFDVSSAASASQAALIPGDARDFYVDQESARLYALMATVPRTIRVVDIANPAAPVIRSTITLLAGNYYWVAGDGKVVVAAKGRPGVEPDPYMQAFWVVSPTAPFEIAAGELNLGYHDDEFLGDMAVISASNGDSRIFRAAYSVGTVTTIGSCPTTCPTLSAAISGPSAGAVGESLTFTATGSGAAVSGYEWSRDSLPTFVTTRQYTTWFSTAVTHEVGVQVSFSVPDGCLGTAQASRSVEITPAALWITPSRLTALIGENIDFSISPLLTQSGDVVDVTFGDGGSSALSYPCPLGICSVSHAYGSAGVFTVNASGTIGGLAHAGSTQVTIAGSLETLFVTKTGAGAGTVTSDPAGIDCGSTCSAQFPYSSLVTLSAVASPFSTFFGWSGDCSDAVPTCQVTMSEARNVVATFDLRPKGADTPGIYRSTDRQWYLKNTNAPGAADLEFPYGDPSDQAVKGDWDGDGDDTVGIYRDGTFYLRNTNTAGPGEIVFLFGAPGDIPIAGDWDGDGIDTIGVYRPATAEWFLRNTNAQGDPDISFTYGLSNETPVTGDWDGDGIDTVGIFRASDRQWYLHNSNAGGNAELVFPYGDPAMDVPVVGDWDGDGDDTVGVYRSSLGEWFLKNTNEAGFADLNFTYGLVNEKPLAGDWDGN